MLYLEDFLELIEPFPQEIRERLTEMREIDLKIQNETDKLDDRLQIFFQQCKKQKADWKNENYEEIRKEYGKLLENADDKIKIANQLYDLIEKYLKKLDQEIQKFKMELEADNAGITSKLEHAAGISGAGPSNADLLAIMGDPTATGAGGNLLNSFSNCMEESDFTLCPASGSDLMMMMNNQSEPATYHQSNTAVAHNKRKHSANQLDKSQLGAAHSLSSALIGKHNDDEDSCSSWNSRIENLNTSTVNIHSRKGTLNATASFKKNLANTSSISSNLSHSSSMLHSVSLTGAAIGANKRLLSSSQQRVKRTKSEKSLHPNRARKSRIMALDEDEEDSFDATEYDQVHSTDDLNDSNDAADSELTSENDHGLNGADLSGNEENLNDDATSDDLDTHPTSVASKLKFAKHNRNPRHFKDDWSSNDDTNERYCICKDVSYGDMIACDNNRCETQWFHFTCVGLNSAPKGKWYCPNCVEIRKKQAEKKPNPLINPSTNAVLVRGTSSTGVINPSNLVNQYPPYLSTNTVSQDPSSAPAASPQPTNANERKNSGSYTPTFKFTTPSSNMASSHTSTTPGVSRSNTNP